MSVFIPEQRIHFNKQLLANAFFTKGNYTMYS
jgi:hypothetical protein